MSTATDRIEKRIEIEAPIARVWRALTDHREFNEWFRVELESPFQPGETTRGRITHPDCKHLTMEVMVEAMEPERYFSFRWNPGADDSIKQTTLVEFHLEQAGPSTTLLRVTESGFDALPPALRDEAFRLNDAGWSEQMENIERHVATDAHA